MKKIIFIAIAVGALAGCSAAEVIEPVEGYEPNAQTESTVTIQTNVRESANVTNFIPIEVLLDKLVESGCVIDTLKYREIDAASKKGGHVEVKCINNNTDALDVGTDL